MVDFNSLRGTTVDKETKFSISRSFTIKSLSFLLAISVIATVLGFGVAYNEHRNLMSLWEKYDEALEKIESCEEAVSELSQQVSAQEKLLEEYRQGITYEDKYYGEEYPTENTADSSAATDAPSSPAVSTGKYYVTKSGSKYHIGTCSFLSKSKIAISMEQIKAEGYTPCSRCIK